MSNTPLLQLPYLAAAQSQKHVTVNDSLRRLDALVHLSVKSASLADAPPGPAEGDRYLVPAGGTGIFQDQENAIAAYQDGAWTLLAPRIGWRCWVEDETRLRVWDGSAWVGAGTAPADGSAGAPGLAFAADPDTGFYRPSDDVLAFVTAGMERIRLAADGKVGIGTADPKEKLHSEGAILIGANETIKSNSYWSGGGFALENGYAGFVRPAGATGRFELAMYGENTAGPGGALAGLRYPFIYDYPTDKLTLAPDTTIGGELIATGHVLQVQSTTKSGTYSLSNDDTWTDVPGLSVSITPKAASSKVMVTAIISGIAESGTGAVRLVRDSIAIGIGDAGGSRVQASAMIGNATGTSLDGGSVSAQFMDNPSTLSAITYKVQVRVNEGTGAVHINRGITDTNTDDFVRTSSTITAMEVGG